MNGYTTKSPREGDTLVSCLVCGLPLSRVMEDAEMQPNDGVYCETAGNYGSTVWDSQDGERLAFLICDPCLVEKGKQGRIVTYRKYRPICVPYGTVGNMVVGTERLQRPFVTWTEDTERDMEPLVLDVEELESIPVRRLPPPQQELYFTPSEARSTIESAERDRRENNAK